DDDGPATTAGQEPPTSAAEPAPLGARARGGSSEWPRDGAAPRRRVGADAAPGRYARAGTRADAGPDDGEDEIVIQPFRRRGRGIEEDDA
ncbi:MAG TPA: hypothetical protein VI248_03485, partial [Kineosporiaceae bacterium]